MPHNGQSRRLASQNLSAEFAANGATAARHQHPPPAQQLGDGLRVNAHGLAAQQILQLNVAHQVNRKAALKQLVERRDHFGLHAHLFAYLDNATHLFARRRRHGNKDLVHGMLRHQLWNLVTGAQHLGAVDGHADFDQVIIHKAHHLEPQLWMHLDFAQAAGARIAGAHNDDVRGGAVRRMAPPAFGEPHAQAVAAHKEQRQQPIHQRNRTGQKAPAWPIGQQQRRQN